ncbi:hypothetical protein [Flavobacterium album]|nr:hypothetical protein [Flavobacterium album]
MEKKGNELRKLPEGTLGREIANCLDSRNLRLVPGFESHDLKHVVLRYKMTPEDEIRMQAFMLGNGNYSLPCFIILLFGMVLLPGLWPILYRDFRLGRNTTPISDWTIEKYAQRDLGELKEIIGNKVMVKKPVNMQAIIRFAAFAVMASGISGMLFCLPFLFSSNMADLVGAGFPFVGGAILVVGGLIALSNLARVQQYDPAKQPVS